MFLAGVIPGPNEPPLDCINPYLTPLLDELLELWDPGVYYSRTHCHRQGRRVRVALVALVCDLPAARKTAGFASYTHKIFCSMCHCHKDREGFVGEAPCRWKRRTNEEVREDASEFARASNIHEREALFKANGVRWSELSRLPYFDLARFVVPDAMHNLFLGLIQTHCTTILGI
ncbi:hypothetical protein FA15DRAFT_594286, partial [Coprinopsis marcescibilis]